MLDNYDSFTYNLVDYIATAGAEVRVERNDAVDGREADRWEPTHLVVSPGPGTPAEAGVSADADRAARPAASRSSASASATR